MAAEPALQVAAPASKPRDSDADRRTGGFTRAISAVTSWLGSVSALTLAVLIVVVWAVTGPAFGYSNTWQLWINTFTTLVTFIMVFIIQNTQNRDGRALQTKLDDLLLAQADGDNELMGLEDEPEQRIKAIQERIRARADKLLDSKEHVVPERSSR